MPYLRCPSCGLLAHVLVNDDTAVIHCPRCRAVQQDIRLEPLEKSLRQVGGGADQPPVSPG
jgi:Zn-finger nucleic acid-binding protein